MLPGYTKKEQEESYKQYMANLRLRIKNNKTNEIANQVYRHTGQLPQELDMRTMEDKLADIEGLKVGLITRFQAITDGGQALQAVGQLTPDEVVFASQHIEEIVDELGRKFKVGVPALALVQYIKALQRKEEVTHGVSFETQEATSQDILRALRNGPAPASRVFNAPKVDFSPIDDSPFQRPDSLQISTPTSTRSSTSHIPSSTPARSSGIDIAELQRISAEKKKQRDSAGFDDPVASRTSSRSKTPFQQELEEKIASRGPSRVSTPELFLHKSLFTMDWLDLVGMCNYYLEKDIQDVTRHIPAEYIASTGPYKGFMKRTQPAGGLPALRESLRDAFNAHLKQHGKKPQHLHQSAMETAAYKQPAVVTDEAGTEMGTEPGVANFAQHMSDIGGKGMRIFPMQGRNHFAIKGRGLRKPVQVDTSRGVQPTSTYVPFGKYIINPSRLKTGRLELKTLRGGAVVKYPARDLTANIAMILRRVLDDRMPDDHDLRSLSPDEQAFLYQLAKDSKIDDRLAIPAPKLDADERELHRFELLKGQVMAGNDNKELVQELKRLLVKLAGEGRLNKTAVRELLLDLAAMGY